MATFTDLLNSNRTSIVGRWRDLIMGAYPGETVKFLKKQQNRFANPVGYSIAQASEELLLELLGDNDEAKLAAILDPVIRIRSVQDMSAAAATGFVWFLKDAIRESLKGELRSLETLQAFLDFESKIDRLGKIAFNVYTECREQLHQVRNDEVRKRAEFLLERVNKSQQWRADKMAEKTARTGQPEGENHKNANAKEEE